MLFDISNSSTVSGIFGIFPIIPHLSTFNLTNPGALSLTPSMLYSLLLLDKSKTLSCGNVLSSLSLSKSSIVIAPESVALIARSVLGKLTYFKISGLPDTFKNNKFGGYS